MKKIIIMITWLCLFCGICCAESICRMEQINGNVIFDADVSGTDISRAAIYNVKLKTSKPELDRPIMDIFDRILFRRDTTADIFEEINGDLPIRNYYTAKGKEQDCADYSFNDGGISACTYEATYYPGVMDIFSKYDATCYIPDRLECGNLPMMSAEAAAEDLHNVAVRLGINVENTPYILRAYSMDTQLIATEGIHPYNQVIFNGEDLTAENRTVISEYGPDCYFVAYRYMFDGIPVSYSYYYLESQDFFTIRGHVYALYNHNGMICFGAFKQFEAVDQSDQLELITVDEAAEKVAEDLNQILGVDSFICKEISLEYVPLGRSGCNAEREAILTPAWVFYFEGDGIMPVLINAVYGSVID